MMNQIILLSSRTPWSTAARILDILLSRSAFFKRWHQMALEACGSSWQNRTIKNTAGRQKLAVCGARSNWECRTDKSTAATKVRQAWWQLRFSKNLVNFFCAVSTIDYLMAQRVRSCEKLCFAFSHCPNRRIDQKMVKNKQQNAKTNSKWRMAHWANDSMNIWANHIRQRLNVQGKAVSGL